MSRQQRWAVPVAIAAITFLAFLPVLHAGFVSWDDQANFLANLDYRGFTGPNLRWMWTTILLGHYTPVSWMSLGLDYSIWGMNPAGYHLDNLLLHAANAVLVYFLARRLLVAAGGTTKSAAPVTLPAACAALYFSLHPLRVESVAWITERRDVLSLFFCLLSVLGYLRASDESPGRVRWYWLSVAAFAGAVLSKAIVVTLPAALLILNVYPLRRLGGAAGWWSSAAARVYRELVPFLLLAAAAARLSITALQPGPQLPLAGKVAVSCYSLMFYLWKTIVPAGLSPLYEMPATIAPAAPVFLVSYAVVAALILWTLSLHRRRPGLLAAGTTFAVLILPLLGIVQNGPQITADRYTYYASPALALIVGGLMVGLQFRRLAVAAAALVLAMLGGLTWRQAGVWQNSATLWSRVLEIDSASGLGNNNFGVVLAENGEPAAAIEHYRRSIASRPAFADPHNNLGYELAQQGKIDEAIEEYTRALALKPDYLDAHINLGNALLDRKHFEEAMTHYEAAAAIRPDHPGLHFDWGLALWQQGKLEAAVEHLSLSVRLDPSYDEARRALAEVTRILDSVRAARPGPP